MEETTKKVLGVVEISPEVADDIKQNVSNLLQLREKIAANVSGNTTVLVDTVLAGAIALGASDVHLEPEEEKARLRIRIDGLLQDVTFFEEPAYKSILARLKLLSKIKLNVTDQPQDGRFSIVEDGMEIEIRTSSLPAEYGESIVLRVLNPKNLKGIEALELRQDLREMFEKEIKRPNGMILVTGPTGSGKTTTLYAFLMKIQNPQIKVITIEDPIEYHLQGISQTQVTRNESHSVSEEFKEAMGQTQHHKGYTFADGLQAIVRQDPDVILVGEIRDSETARIALQASLTGHLVLSTLHTNDAAGTIPRLIDLGAEVSSVAPALKMVIAQRLVRKVCKECSKLTKPTAEELEEIKKALTNLQKYLGVKNVTDVKIPSAIEKGCKTCSFTGYKGRKALYEAFTVDNEIERFILTNPPVSEIKQLAMKKGMVTMYQAGMIEVINGNTTIEEVKKAVGEED